MRKTFVVILSCLSFGARADEPTGDLLNATTRGLLHERMKRHEADALKLVRSVLTLEHAQTLRLAATIASEPRLTRPMPGDGDVLNRQLPERFFVLQDELRLKARSLEAAAKKRDDVVLAQRLGEMLQTCVSCHAAFLPAPIEK